jgi:predicted dehydrogenase
MGAIGTVGIVGLGAAGGFALAGLRGIPGARCAVGVDLRGTTAMSASELEGRVSDQLDALERVAPLDLVILSTPTPDHPKTAVTILCGAHPPARLWIDKPMAATRDGHTQIRSAPGGSGVRVLFHTAFAPEVLWATERVVPWRDRHGRIVKVVCDFNDPYAETAEVRAAVLADSWSDSGINALSVVARFVRLDRLVEVMGTRPLHVRANFAMHDGQLEGHALIRTTWTPSSSRKTTALCFEDGTTITLDHQDTTVTASDPYGRTLEVHRLGRRSLSDRYATMFASYATEDTLLFSTKVEDTLHGQLHAVTEELERTSAKNPPRSACRPTSARRPPCDARSPARCHHPGDEAGHTAHYGEPHE